MKTFRISLVCLSFMTLLSCSKWQETQVDKDVIEVFIPRDSLVTDIVSQLFYWYPVNGVEKYELQIASPSFNQINQLVLDTNLSGTQFEFTLKPGSYEWSIRGYNHSSSTDYTTYRLYIDSTLNLTSQTILLTSPKDHDTSNQLAQHFNWQALYNAENYLFELYQPKQTGQLVYTMVTTDNFIYYNLPDEGSFEWRVRGQNSNSLSNFSTRQLFTDTTAPNIPSLLIPASNAILNAGDVSFEWSKSNGIGSSTFDTLYVALDSTLSSLKDKKHASYGEATIDTLASGVYYWGVRSFDIAGNKSKMSAIRKFTLQ